MSAPIPRTEPDISFLYARYKLKRADKHICDLYKVCRESVKAYPPAIRLEREFNEPQYRIVFEPGPLSYEIPAITGDAVHNLRAALDYCWMGLYRAVLGKNAGKRTFPFSDGSESLVRTVRDALKKIPLQGLEEFVLNIVKPYKGGNDVLVSVNKLDNIDKHNTLNFALGVTNIVEMRIKSSMGRVMEFSNNQVSGGTFSPFAIRPYEGEILELDGYPKLTTEIFLYEPGKVREVPVIPFLADALRETAKAVEAFQEAFGGGRMTLIPPVTE